MSDNIQLIADKPVLSTVVLNWNRADLLRTTIESYLRTITTPYELIIVDNASTDRSRKFISEICEDRPNHRAIFLSRNSGGEGLNIGLAECHGLFMHISENDLEYLPGWDQELLSKFQAFPELGQLSLFSPFHQVEDGEIWTDKAGVQIKREASTIYKALSNVGTSGVIRRDVWDRGVRWQAHGTESFWSPDDAAFSEAVKALGYMVAWNDEYVVVNWGHNVLEMSRRLIYYQNNADGKPYLGLTGLRAALEEHGYTVLEQPVGQWAVEQVLPLSQSNAAKRTALWREWMKELGDAIDELEQVIPAGGTFLLVDDEQFGLEILPGRSAIPFISERGRYWGPPADDAMAISEIERMNQAGAEYVVFMWPCFWWLEHYSEFRSYLYSRFNVLSETSRSVVFDLRKRLIDDSVAIDTSELVAS